MSAVLFRVYKAVTALTTVALNEFDTHVGTFMQLSLLLDLTKLDCDNASQAASLQTCHQAAPHQYCDRL